MSGKPKTLYQKIREHHLVGLSDARPDLIYIDLHLLHEVTSPQAFEGLRLSNRKVRCPQLCQATVDHAVPTIHREKPWSDPMAIAQVSALERNCKEAGISFFGVDDARQGILHIVSPQQGLTQPGMTIVCGDSHTATHGAFGALAFGIGTSEVEHVLATQTLMQDVMETMAVEVQGALCKGVVAKDLILEIINKLGVDGGVGHVIEYKGEAISALSMEGRMTVCNMSIEAGARAGIIAPDEVTFSYLKDRPFAPKGALWDAAIDYWRTLKTDDGVRFDKVVKIDASNIEPRVTWGTTPAQSVPVTGSVPHPNEASNGAIKAQMKRALDYMGLKPGTKIKDINVDRVFIGSCTNGQIEDLRAAAAVVKGAKVAKGVGAMVVPGSGPVKTMAQAEGLDKIFIDAGFEWRDPGCSMCLGMNTDVLGSGERCASTSNRNFEGRQGPGGRTHLVSPAMAATAAIMGHFADVREVIS